MGSGGHAGGMSQLCCREFVMGSGLEDTQVGCL